MAGNSRHGDGISRKSLKINSFISIILPKTCAVKAWRPERHEDKKGTRKNNEEYKTN